MGMSRKLFVNSPVLKIKQITSLSLKLWADISI